MPHESVEETAGGDRPTAGRTGRSGAGAVQCAARGIGAAIAGALALEGARVWLTDVSVDAVGIAGAPAYASDEAPYITGSELNIDGGLLAGAAPHRRVQNDDQARQCLEFVIRGTMR